MCCILGIGGSAGGEAMRVLRKRLACAGGKREQFSPGCVRESIVSIPIPPKGSFGREALPAFQKYERRDPAQRDFASFSGTRERRMTSRLLFKMSHYQKVNVLPRKNLYIIDEAREMSDTFLNLPYQIFQHVAIFPIKCTTSTAHKRAPSKMVAFEKKKQVIPCLTGIQSQSTELDSQRVVYDPTGR